MAVIDAALISGGQSSRFGSDKAFIEWQGKPLYLHQLQKLLRLDFNQVWLSTRADQDFPDHIEGVTRINDTRDDLGPIGALQTLLHASEADFIQLLAVDMPLYEIGDVCEKSIVPKLNDRWEPLVGCYNRQAFLPLIEQQIEVGKLSLQQLLNLAKKKSLVTSLEAAEKEQDRYTNINTLTDLKQTQQGVVDDSIMLTRYSRDRNDYGKPEVDYVAKEEPLEVRVNQQSVAVMMRTPGHDQELATGFLYTEGVIEAALEIIDIEHCPDVDPEGLGNTLNVKLSSDTDLSELTRHVFTSSSCGVCGKATIDSVFQSFAPLPEKQSFDPNVILGLPEKLRTHQETFAKTGGLHASALFNNRGELKLIREDVGRHNALDKVIGHALAKKWDTQELILLVSGRISFELMQKALAAKIPVIAGISAPSSLAVNLARQSNVALIGFLRMKGFNVYS